MEPGASLLKPMRARKTMTPSSRKHVAMLKRMKGIGQPGRASSGGLGGESPSADPRGVNVWNRTDPVEQNVLPPPPATVVEPVAGLAAALDISVCGGPREAAQELPKSPPKTNMDQFLSAGALQDLLHQWYESETSFSPPKPVEVHLNVVPASCCSDRSEELQFPPASAANHSQEHNGNEPLLDGLAGVVSEQENGVSQEAPGSSVPLVLPGNLFEDGAQRKRRKLESAQSALHKRPHASDRAGEDGAGEGGSTGHRQQNSLENVKAFVRGHLDVAVGALDRTLQDTSRRLEHTQCLRKHEGVVIKVLERTSRLQKQVNAMFAMQAELSKKMKLLGLGAPNKILNGCVSLPGHANHQPVLSTKTTSGGSQVLPAVAKGLASSKASPRAAESSDGVMCLEKRPPGVPTANASGVPRDGTPGATPVSAPTPDTRKDTLVIDLTEEGSVARAALGKEERTAASGKAIPASEGPEVGPPQPPPKEVPWGRVHLPPLPKVRLLPEEVKDFQGTSPPQKLQLMVVELLNPKCLALQWNVQQVDSRCALLDSFHLFFFLDSDSAPFSWTRMRVVQALPLPMFVALGELPASGRYYFIMQSKDVYGRYGPFSDVKSASMT